MTEYYVVLKRIWYRPDQKYYANGTVMLDHLTDKQIQLLIDRKVVTPYKVPRRR
jgi:hypothetical protein